MTRRRALLAIVGLCAVAACARRKAPADPTDARRVVSLAPSTTEALYAVGAGDRVVGRSTYCDYPPEATKLPALGGVEPDVEAVLELQPDLVVDIAGAASQRVAEKIAAHGIATWFAPTDSLADIDAMLLGVGARTGHAARAEEVVKDLDEHVRAVERAVAAEARPRVLLVVGAAPIVAAGPRSFADELVRRAGAVNVVLEGGAWQTIAFERIAELDPDVVLDASEDAARITADAPGWGTLRAVRQPGHVIRIRDERVLRAGPRIGDGLTVLARMLHPGVAVP